MLTNQQAIDNIERNKLTVETLRLAVQALREIEELKNICTPLKCANVGIECSECIRQQGRTDHYEERGKK